MKVVIVDAGITQSLEYAWKNPIIACANTRKKCDKSILKYYISSRGNIGYGRCAKVCSSSCRNQTYRKHNDIIPDIGIPWIDALPTHIIIQEDYHHIEVVLDGKDQRRSRIVLEYKLGRELLPGEEAHHENHNSVDDRPENISLMPSKSKHSIETQNWHSNDVFEVLAIAKSKDGILRLEDGNEITMFDENHSVIFGYVDSDNQIKEMKILIDGVVSNRYD